MKSYLVTLATLLCLPSCYPKAIVVQPIAPRAVRVAEAAAATSKGADKVKISITKVKDQSSKLQKDLIAGMLAADALRKAGLATQEQLDANASAWRTAHQRNLFLEEYIRGADIDTTDLQVFAKNGEAESTTLVEEAVKTDKATEELKTDIVKQADNAALGRNVKWIVGIVLSLVLLYMILRFLVPAVVQAFKPPLT